MLFATAEVRRSKARFALLTVGAGLLVFVLLFQQVLLDSILEGMAGAVTQQSAPVLVLAAESEGSVSGSALTDDQVAEVAAAPGVADAAELAVTFLSFRSPGSDDWHNASVLGFRPGRPGAPTALRSGRLPEAAGEAVASAEDAPGRYGIGDTLLVEPGSIPVVVVGLTEGGRMGLSPTLWTPWATYGQLVRQARPEAEVLASVAAVEAADGVAPGDLVRDLNQRLVGLEAMTREAAAARTPGRDAIQAGFRLVMGLSYLVVALVIGFFFLTLTLHKQSSVTLVRAMGARGSYLVRGLLGQVTLVSIGGLGIGVLLLFGLAPLLRSSLVLTVDAAGLARAAAPALGVALAGAAPSARRLVRADPSRVFGQPSLGGPA